jgi:hypothetical protein
MKAARSRLRTLTAALLAGVMLLPLVAGCGTDAPAQPGPNVPPSSPQGAPVVVVDRAKLAPTREEACRRVATKEVKDPAQGALGAGMLLADYEGFRSALVKLHATVTFRDSNPACIPHLAAGVQSKGHDILQKTWDASNLLPEDQNLAGLVSNLMVKPPKGQKVAHPQLTLKNGEPVTGDHDMMDMLEPDGARIPGETPRDLEIRAALNAAAAPTPRGHRDRVMHGCQAAYAQYAKLHPEESVIAVLLKPEAPLTAFDQDGKVYHLETVEDDLDFYRCKGAALVPEWDVEAEDRATTPPRRERLH